MPIPHDTAHRTPSAIRNSHAAIYVALLGHDLGAVRGRMPSRWSRYVHSCTSHGYSLGRTVRWAAVAVRGLQWRISIDVITSSRHGNCARRLVHKL